MIKGKEKTQQNLMLLMLVLVIIFTFIPALSNQFVSMDDPTHLLDNPQVRSISIENIIRIFKSTVNSSYMPLTVLSFTLEYHFFNFNPFIYHLNNLILHIFNVLLIFYFGRKLGLSAIGAGAGALLFGIHPMHVESVVWVTERKDVLYVFFYLLSLSLYWNYLHSKKISIYIVSIVMGVLSILSKNMALNLPLILFALDWFHKRKFSLNCLFDKIPYFLIFSPIVFKAYLLNKSQVIVRDNLFEVILICIRNFVFYLYKFFYPVKLSPLYVFPEPVLITHIPFLFSVAGLVLIFIVLIRFRRDRWLIFAFLFYLLSVFFFLRYDDNGFVTTISDRRMYLPSLGFCLWFGFCVERMLRLFDRPKTKLKYVPVLIVIVIFILLSCKSFNQTKIWKDEETLWNHVIKSGIVSPLPYFALGNVEYKRGSYQKALDLYSKSIALGPRGKLSHNNRGLTYLKLGEYELAGKDFERAFKINPNFAEAFNNRGMIRYYYNDDARALEDFSRAIEIDPDQPLFYFNRANLYKETARCRLAIEDYKRVLRLDPQNSNAAARIAECLQ